MSASSGARRNGAVITMHRPSAGERPALGVRLRARLQGWRLDRRLAAGEQPWLRPELRWRAAELTSRRQRRKLAEEIDALMESATRPPHPLGAAVPLDRAGVRACGELLRELADELRQAEQIEARGVALVRQLLRDGGSALYAPEAEGALESAIRHARAALFLG
jgi:hypothetical protein